MLYLWVPCPDTSWYTQHTPEEKSAMLMRHPRSFLEMKSWSCLTGAAQSDAAQIQSALKSVQAKLGRSLRAPERPLLDLGMGLSYELDTSDASLLVSPSLPSSQENEVKQCTAEIISLYELSEFGQALTKENQFIVHFAGSLEGEGLVFSKGAAQSSAQGEQALAAGQQPCGPAC